ncbi:MAG: DUF177 domain-containing protein [Alphaproteobacteria bacterium]|nr:DUF177 domain-containing protein [Alphaproteobacteria bacterium]
MTMRDQPALAAGELCRPLALDRLDREGVVELEIVADPAECAALARRFGLAALVSLSAKLRLRRNTIGHVLVVGHVSAAPVYTCVVTVEPFTGAVEEDFSLRFAPPDGEEPADRSAGPEDEDPPEPLAGDALELGEVVAQQLALALDPHPRSPKAKLDEAARNAAREDDGERAGRSEGPFAALERLRRER